MIAQRSALDAAPITSPANPQIKRLRALAQRRYREQEGAFAVEGIRHVWQAVESAAPIELIVVAPDLLGSDPALAMVADAAASGIRVVRVSGPVFRSFAERDHPSGLAAVVRVAPSRLDDLPVGPGALFVALHEAGNPGNLGTILRTMDAVASGGLILIGSATDPYHPTAVKASMGTLFTVPIVRVAAPEDLLRWCRASGIGVVTTSSSATQDHWSARYPDPCLLLFGSEGRGLADGLLDAGDVAVRIPMAGSADSLNLAVAVGILLYEARRGTAP